MNLLIFILSLIMILAAMSYARFESFLKSELQSKEWRGVLIESQRDLYNQEQRQFKPKSKPKPPSEPKEKDPNEPRTEKTKAGVGQISLQWLFKPSSEKAEPFRQLAKSLIEIQWGKQPFYRNIVKDRPDFLDQLFDTIRNIAQNAKKGIKNLDELMKAPWPDPELKVAFGRMLQDGLVYEKDHLHDDGTSDVVYASPKGFQSLKDYFTTKSSDKIRVWLAPRPVLLAIFRDPAIVADIVNWRASHFRQARARDGAVRKQLSSEFNQEFSSKTTFSDLLDWEVTSTIPL